jgi:hypothetical protein
MRSRLRNDGWRLAVFFLLVLAFAGRTYAESFVLQLKNGDRVTGKILSESTNSVTLTTPFFGTIQVPFDQIVRRDQLPEVTGTNTPPKVASASTNAPRGPAHSAMPAAHHPPMSPANPEATPIASTPKYWKHDLRFGLNTRYAAKDSQEILIIGKSTYGKAPFRHIFDAKFQYGTIEGVVSANSVTGAEKTEYQLSPKTYLFNLLGAGFDETRHIDAEADIGPGVGVELLKLTNFVWKTESGFSFQQQYRSDDTQQTSYSLRIAEIFAWRVWEKLTADAKIEFLPNLGEIGEYRLRLETNLRYPISNRISLNLDLIDVYDTQPAKDVSPNDLQIRSTIGVSF